jgi:hypothetical protein
MTDWARAEDTVASDNSHVPSVRRRHTSPQACGYTALKLDQIVAAFRRKGTDWSRKEDYRELRSLDGLV